MFSPCQFAAEIATSLKNLLFDIIADLIKVNLVEVARMRAIYATLKLLARSADSVA